MLKKILCGITIGLCVFIMVCCGSNVQENEMRELESPKNNNIVITHLV